MKAKSQNAVVYALSPPTEESVTPKTTADSSVGNAPTRVGYDSDDLLSHHKCQ